MTIVANRQMSEKLNVIIVSPPSVLRTGGEKKVLTPWKWGLTASRQQTRVCHAV